MIIRKANLKDRFQIFHLYKTVAKTFPGNLTQEEEEITIEYVTEMLSSSIERGLALVIEKDSFIVGYMKAFTSKFKCLAHVLTDTTIMIDPNFVGKSGFGSLLFNEFKNIIQTEMQYIKRFELLPHEKNQKAIDVYVKLGCSVEKISNQRIRNIDGTFGSEVCLVWYNPFFDESYLEKYFIYLSILNGRNKFYIKEYKRELKAIS